MTLLLEVQLEEVKMTQEPLYPVGHPKTIEQDSQRNNTTAPSLSKKKKKNKNDRTLHASSEPEVEKPPDNNDVSISDAETQCGNEHSPSDNEKYNDDVHEDTQPKFDKELDNDVEIKPAFDLDNPQPKNKRYDKRDFVTRKHGREREPWVQKPMPFPPKSTKKKDDEEFECFAEMIRPVFCVLA